MIGIIRFFSLTALCLFASFGANGAGIELVSEYLEGQKITDICEWKGKIWASTPQGLYRIEEEEAVKIPLPIATNDQITSIYSGSPYTLICGTFQGDLLFVTHGSNDYCKAVWNLKDILHNTSFYVNSVVQNEQGIWLGTLEKGVLLYNPNTDSLTQFSLDFNADTIGKNVYQIEQQANNVHWVISQDGLYFIMNIFGPEDELQFVKSSRIKQKPYALDQNGKSVFLAYRSKGENYLGQTKFGKNAFDVRIKKKIKLPKGQIKDIEVSSLNDAWVLNEKLNHLHNGRISEYYISSASKTAITSQKLIKRGDEIYISTLENGILKYSTKPKPAKHQDDNLRFDSEKLSYNSILELDLLFFAPGDSSLSPSSYSQLKELENILLEDSSLTISLTGHTAMDGDLAYLQLLSQGRANAVRNYLIAKGIHPKRISAIGRGAFELKNSGKPKSSKNRRVEIILNR